MQWTHARPTEPGYYWIDHPTIQQQVLELCLNEYENEEPSLSWEDINRDDGFEYLEMPDDAMYCGPFQRPPMNVNPEDD